MKKIYSLFMALGIALCAMANFSMANKQLNLSSATAAQAEKHSLMAQKHQAIAEKHQNATVAMNVNGLRQNVAIQSIAKQAMPANAVRKAPAKAAAAATNTVETRSSLM